MKFKCGLTQEEEAAKKKAEEERWVKLIKEGVEIFAWWPIRIKKGDCRWLEKVRMFPTSLDYFPIVNNKEYSWQYTSAEAAKAIVYGNEIVTEWRYEAVQD